jgi:hypothetical protein
MMDKEQVIERCRLICGAEAITQGFPVTLGYQVFYLCRVPEALEWTRKDVLTYAGGLRVMYPQYSQQNLFILMTSIIKIKIDYINLIKS